VPNRFIGYRRENTSIIHISPENRTIRSGPPKVFRTQTNATTKLTWSQGRLGKPSDEQVRKEEQPRKLVRGQFNDKHQHRYNKVLKPKCERNTD